MQEEIAELKGELRKALSDAKNQMRRLSAGRRGSVEGGFGFRQSAGGDRDDLAPGKGTPHTPSKKLSEAKHRCVWGEGVCVCLVEERCDFLFCRGFGGSSYNMRRVVPQKVD